MVKCLPIMWVGPGSIPGLGRSPGEGNGNPLQYFCLENPMDGGAWLATVHGGAKSHRVWLRDFTFHFGPLAIWDEPLFCHHVFRFIHVNLSKSLLLGDVDFPSARELELGLAEGLSHMLLVLQLGVDELYDLATVDPGHCALGLSKGTVHTCLQPRLRPAGQSQMSPGKGCFQGPLGQPTQATGCIYYPTFAVTAHQAPKGNGA